MLKLSKYELRKNRNALLILLGGLVIFQLFYLFSIYYKDNNYVASSIALLTLFSLVCYFSIFLFAISNYYREITSRTSYLVFMTPVSSLCVILSKMLTVLFLGCIMAVVIGILAVIDLQIFTQYHGEYAQMAEMINDLFAQFGFNLSEIFANLLFGLITFLLSFFSTVALIYLCISLAVTLLQNSRLKMIVSVLFFFAATWLKSKLQEQIGEFYPFDYSQLTTAADYLIQSLPYTLLNLGVLLISIFITTWLLSKKLSL